MATLRTVTVKASGGDYTSLKDAIGMEAIDITAATGSDEIVRIDCYPFEDTTNVVTVGMPEWTTSPTNYVELRFVDGAGVPLYVGKWSTSAYRLVGTNGVFQNNQINHLWHTEGTFQVMDNLGTSTSTGGVFKCTVDAAGGWNRFDGGGILIVNHNSGTAWRGFKIDRGMDCRWRNWIGYGGNNEGVFSPAIDVPAGSGAPTLTFENCTFDDWSEVEFIADAGTTLILTNCRATGIPGDLATAGQPDRMDPSSDFNITDAETANEVNWGTNSLNSSDTPTIDYVDDTNADLTLRDYRLNSASDSGYQAGTDLSGSFTVDIEDSTRTTPWDMGAHEASVSADVIVAASTHALTLTEQAATINAAINVQASTDALIVSELVATVNAASSLTGSSFVFTSP